MNAWLHTGVVMKHRVCPPPTVGVGGASKAYRNMFHAVTKIAGQEGVFALYNGWVLVTFLLPFEWNSFCWLTCTLHLSRQFVCRVAASSHVHDLSHGDLYQSVRSPFRAWWSIAWILRQTWHRHDRGHDWLVHRDSNRSVSYSHDIGRTVSPICHELSSFFGAFDILIPCYTGGNYRYSKVYSYILVSTP